MVSARAETASRAWRAAASVVDPELRMVTIEELGILRDVTEDDATGRVTVTITPTYSGCPAMHVITADVRRAVQRAGYADVAVETVLSPAWSTDMISPTGREKLHSAGIAPPEPAGPVRGASVSEPRSRERGLTLQTRGPDRSTVVALQLSVRCPRCGSLDTEEISRFGSTACKALWRCRACGDPFDRVKPL